MKKIILIATLLLPIVSFSKVEIQITGVHDGDTLTGQNIKKQEIYKIRLAHIDTPETGFQQKSQGEISTKARSFLSSLIPANGVITLMNETDTDRHGRILGRLQTNGKDINIEMARSGWGLPYSINPTNKDYMLRIAEACMYAEENNLGMFAPENADEFEEPYEFRMRISKRRGTNLIANVLTGELHTVDTISRVPVCLRVFYSSEILANDHGYHF